jgi:RTX calcium-binding nonapeptide repeat (4 copies)
MMYRRTLTIIGVAGLILAGTASTAMAASPGKPGSSTTICHATRSATHPYVQITVSNDALAAHKQHQDRRDLIPAPSKGCPVPPPPGPDTGPFVPCVVGPGVTQTATTVTGSSADDTIDCTGASPGKTIVGGDGNDTITGTAFDDTVFGGNGNDTITGGPGIDYIEGNAGNDTLTGSDGDDTLIGGTGNDTLSGGTGNDTLIGLPADANPDSVNGDAGQDTCNGATAEGDTLTGCEM